MVWEITMNKMLNLKVHGYYKFSCGPYADYAGYVAAKNVQNKSEHTYLVVWPTEAKRGAAQPTCVYLHDTGQANQGFNGFLTRSIVKCKEMTLEERRKMYHKFMVLGQASNVWWDDPAKYGIKWRSKV